ncbi:GH32 C-terminal domain-containing protein [Halomarina pelagica]|uniref:GH32 C-terminal domain-containing protein n=1 Tax=Halomarina pelagica TaxID=2961599 RepID=UPI0020C40ACC|nr:GH32 C-terminal domain-containing protein [Halomarina sp. BND7]
MYVGCLRRGESTGEQRVAYDWCRGTFPDAATVSFDAVASGDVDLGAFDALWWHRDAPLDDADWLADCAEAFRTAADEGTGLLLSLHALSAVEALGIDAVAPDATGTDDVAEPAGLLCKTVHADHPLFAGFETLRVHTRGAGVAQPFARYEVVLPERGETLACGLRGDEECYPHKTVVGWDWGAGAVVGAGDALAFAEPTDEACDRARRRFVEDALRTLADRPETVTDRPATGEELRALRAAVEDHNRPRYHVTSPANWLNDPNGLVHWNGRYHVFYQYNPAGPFHGTIHWGHAVSDDLVRWEDEPVALSPDPDGPDRDGCWSGCTVVHDGTPTFVYTGGRGGIQLPCLATAEDPDLRRWRKDPDNPVIEEAPVELDVLNSDHWHAEFRDHCVWRDGEFWYQLIGSGITDVGGTVLRYRSADLREWTYLGPVLTGTWEGAGAMWECPELLDLGERELLHVSNYADVWYFLGELDDGRFHVDSRGKLDYGDFYAPQSLTDETGRELTFGWLPEARSERAQWDAGWSGALSLPRELSLAEDGGLRQRPAPEVTDLRRSHAALTDLVVDGETPLDASGTALELALTVRVEDAEAFSLVVRESDDGTERTPLRYADGELVIDRSSASLDPETASDDQRMPVGTPDGTLSLRVFVDGSVIEAFANDRRCLTSRVYPTRADSDGVSLRAEGGEAVVERLDVWELGDAWPAAPSAGMSASSPTPE